MTREEEAAFTPKVEGFFLLVANTIKFEGMIYK
jgi:hypothetical protein